MVSLGIEEFSAYRERLESDPQEWSAVDESCHITISRFFRDRAVFELLRNHVLPKIAARAQREQRKARFWSIGCGCGEEPYTLKILWDLVLAGDFPDVDLSVIATDVDETVLARTREGCFQPTSLRELPPTLIPQAFDRIDGRFCLRPRHRENVLFLRQDVRSHAPSGRFDLVLCRNVAFTYFSAPLQRRVLATIIERQLVHGFLVIGAHERLPADRPELSPLAGTSLFFERREAASER
jgi:chemotaxis protein methyltransferase CheR